MKKLSLALVLTLIGITSMLAQRTIMGTVTGDDGSALIGATVLVKGTSTGTVTDIDGKYSVRIPGDGSILVVSYTGFSTQEVAVGASNVVDVTLKSGQVLEEIVVTALGISKSEKSVGYAVQSVGSGELLKANETNLVQSLAGKVAGLQVTGSTGAAGGSSFFLLRGVNTISGENQPLIVIDGVPVDNSQLRSGGGGPVASVAFSNRAVDINQSDIESVSVLKGAAATALYGSLAGNGAIIITTKKGKIGQQKVSVEFSSNVTFSQFNKVPDLQNTYGQGSAGKYLGPETRSAFSWGPNMDTMRYANSSYVLTATQDLNGDGVYDWDKNGFLVGQSSPFASSNPARTYDPYDFFQTGIATNNNLAISAANANSSLRFSVGYTNETGIIPNNDFKRINFGLNADTRLTDKIKLGVGVQYINSGGTRIEQGSNISGVMLGLLRTATSFDNSAGFDDIDEENNAAYTFPDGRPRGYRGLNAAGTSTYDNPYWTAYNNPLEDNVNRLIGNFSVSYDPTSWLNITWRPGVDLYSDFRKQYFAVYSATNPTGQVFEDQFFNKRWNSDLLATVKQDLTSDIGMSFTIGHNIREFRLDNLYSQGDGLVIPGFYDLSNASSVRSVANNNISRNQGVFGVLDLDYKDWLYISGTLRNEQDLSLPEDNNSYWYYSASGSVVLSELMNLQNNPTLSFAKLRGSYGRVGLGTFAYSTATYFQAGGYGDGWTQGINFPFKGNSAFTFSDVLGNPNLKPEFRDSWEAGLDLRFFRNRIGLDLTYYKSISKDIILSVPVTASSGFQNTIQNAAQLSNKGIELILTANPVRTNDFSWDMLVNFTRNRNSVDQLADGVDQVFLGGFTGASTRAVVGVPYGSIFGQGFYKDANGATVIDGREFLSNGNANPNYLFPIIDPNEKAFNSALPDFTVGIRNTFTYKGVSVSALLDIKEGGYMWNGTKGALYYFGTHQETADRRNTAEVFKGNLAVFDGDNIVLYDHDNNDKTPDIPQTSGANTNEVVVTQSNWLSTGNGNSFFGSNTEDFVEETSWVRLRDVSISYTLPKRLLNSAKISNLTISVSGRNLWLKTPYTGIDPETNLYGASNAQGLDYFNMPGTKSYSVGLSVGF